MSILKKLLNKSIYQTGGVKFVKTVIPKPKQTSSYTPSDTTVKVVDTKTGRPYMYDKMYDALFDTNGNQLDSDDHRYIREVGKGGTRVKQEALVQNKRNELQTKGITSEYASRYRPGESEKIALLLNSRFKGTEPSSTSYQETKNTSDYATSVDGSDITAKADYITKEEYMKDDINDVEVGLKMQFGLPQTLHKGSDKYNNYTLDISDDKPSINAQRDYYFKPIIHPRKDKNLSAKTLNSLNSGIFNQDAFDKYLVDAGKDLPVNESKVINTPYAHLGHVTISHGIDDKGHYISLYDDIDYDPQKGYYGAVNLLPNSTYYSALDKINFPKEKQKKAVEDFKNNRDLATILGYNNAEVKENNKTVSGGIPIYFRTHYDLKTKTPIKVKNKFTSGGITEAQPVLPKKVVKLDGKYVEVYMDTNKKPIFANSNEIDNSKIRKTTLGDEYNLEGTTYLLNSEEPVSTNPVKPTPVITDDKTSDRKETSSVSTFKINNNISLPTLNTDTPKKDIGLSMPKSQSSASIKDIGINTNNSNDKKYKGIGLRETEKETYKQATEDKPVTKTISETNNTPIKEYQERIGVPVTGVLDEETISTFETLVIEGMKSNDQKVKNYTLDIFYKNAPKDLIDKATNISYLSYAPMLGLDKQSKDAFAKDFAYSYTRTSNPPTIYKEVLKKFPYLQQYINAEKKYSTNSYAYGGYSKRFI